MPPCQVLKLYADIEERFPEFIGPDMNLPTIAAMCEAGWTCRGHILLQFDQFLFFFGNGVTPFFVSLILHPRSGRIQKPTSRKKERKKEKETDRERERGDIDGLPHFCFCFSSLLSAFAVSAPELLYSFCLCWFFLFLLFPSSIQIKSGTVRLVERRTLGRIRLSGHISGDQRTHSILPVASHDAVLQG